jgi:zinc transporter ZupT
MIAINETRTESQASAAWGCMLLLGFVSAFILDSIVALLTGGAVTHTHDVPPVDTEAPKAQTMVVTSNGSALGSFPADGFYGSAPGSFPADGFYRPSPPGGGPLVMGNAFGANVEEIDADIAAAVASRARQKRIFCGILLGDFMHNFVDGLFIAAGFLNCGPTMGWSIVAASVYHEIAQEVADFVILTDPMQGNLSAPFALLVNFLSGTGVIFGVICMLGQDQMDNYDAGMLLAFGGGIYLQIGAAEAMPKV